MSRPASIIICGTYKINAACTLKGHYIEFKYYADGIHYGLTPPGNNT